MAVDAPVGGAAMRGGGIPDSAHSVRPSPRRADADRGQAYDDGCHVEKAGTESPPCVYGNAQSSTTVVLFGDSHALHFFPAMRWVAERRGWRLISLTKSGCPPADVDIYYRPERRLYTECAAWREAILRRIEVEEKPALVVTSGRVNTGAMKHGKLLGRAQGLDALARGYARAVKRLVADGADVVAIRDVPQPPGNIPKCVAKEMHHLRRCAFPKRSALPHDAPIRAALRRVDGVRQIDPAKKLCVGRLCPAVTDDMIVYRNAGHLTATFAATLAPWLDRKLGDVP